jgi:acyl-CoA synthetase (AMP-forming)/AMP-acid ligase II
VDIDPACDLAALVWSSGTEGLPRPVRFTHRNLVAGLAQIECLRYILPGDRVLGLLPYTHVYGALVGLCLPTRMGATVVSLMRFELGEFLRTLRDHHIAVAHLVPPLVSALALHPAVSGLELPALRGIVCGASALDPALARLCAERLGCYVVEGYGMTEALATHVVLDYEGGRYLGTVGQALPLTEFRLVDPENRQPVPAGQEGEIQCRGPALSNGCLNGPPLLDEDGWLCTGDLGRVDEEGRLRIVDRLKELIKRNGAQVAPALIEARLRACPGVVDAAVLGLPDALEGEVPVGLVQLSQPLDLEELRRRVNSQGSPEEQLCWLRSLERVPRSLAGKLLRRQLRADLSLPPFPR